MPFPASEAYAPGRARVSLVKQVLKYGILPYPAYKKIHLLVICDTCHALHPRQLRKAKARCCQTNSWACDKRRGGNGTRTQTELLILLYCCTSTMVLLLVVVVVVVFRVGVFF